MLLMVPVVTVNKETIEKFLYVCNKLIYCLSDRLCNFHFEVLVVWLTRILEEILQSRKDPTPCPQVVHIMICCTVM